MVNRLSLTEEQSKKCPRNAASMSVFSAWGIGTKARFVPHVSGFENDGTPSDWTPQLRLRNDNAAPKPPPGQNEVNCPTFDSPTFLSLQNSFFPPIIFKRSYRSIEGEMADSLAVSPSRDPVFDPNPRSERGSEDCSGLLRRLQPFGKE